MYRILGLFFQCGVNALHTGKMGSIQYSPTYSDCVHNDVNNHFVFCVQAKELPTFKDNDFLNEGHKIQIGDDNKKYILEKLKRDVEVGDFHEHYRGLTPYNKDFVSTLTTQFI